jgi:hypothetical protein
MDTLEVASSSASSSINAVARRGRPHTSGGSNLTLASYTMDPVVIDGVRYSSRSEAKRSLIMKLINTSQKIPGIEDRFDDLQGALVKHVVNGSMAFNDFFVKFALNVGNDE